MERIHMKTDIQLNSEAVRFRQKVGYSNREPIDVESIVLTMANYTLVKLDLSNNISGMCIVDEASKVIAINSAMSIGRQRYTIAHELYHLEIEQLTEGKVCPTGIYDNRTENEKEADMFASFLLMPYDGLEWYVEKFHILEWNLKNIIDLSQFYKLSYMAVLFRLKYEGRITAEELEQLKNINVKNQALKYGYDISLYNSSQEDERWITLGEYPRILEEKRYAIPESLYRQFCKEGFRDAVEQGKLEEGDGLND